MQLFPETSVDKIHKERWRMAAVDVWERQPGESPQSFEAFAIYRNFRQGTRSLARVASELTKSAHLIRRWSAKHNWVDRVEEWDAYQDKIALEAQLRAVKDMNERHVRMSMALQSKALKKLEALDPDELTPSQLLQYLLESSRLERLARGEPEKIEDRREKIEAKVDVDFDEVAQRAAPALMRLIERGALEKPKLSFIEGGKSSE